MGYMHKELNDMTVIPAPAGVATPYVQHETEDGITWCYGTTVPSDAATGYAPGCTFVDTDSGAKYINEGTAASADFNQIVTVENIDSAVSAAEVVAHIEATELADTAASASPSPLIWDNCPWLQFALGADNGLVYFNHFNGNYVLAANQSATDLGNGVAGFTGASAGQVIQMPTDEPTGVVEMVSTNDNETTGISVGGGLNTAGQYLFTSGKKTWFEARVKFSNITDDKAGAFLGFAEEALLSEDGIIADAGSLADKDFVGFWRLEGDGDKLDTYHNTAGGGGTTELAADAVTVVADTYIKLGGYFDGTTLTLYADGVALDDTVAYNATNFPDGEEMAFYFVISNASGDDFIASIDWLRIAREI